MRTSMVIVFLILVGLVAAPFILKASREVAKRLGDLWKEEVLDEDPKPEIEKEEADDHH